MTKCTRCHINEGLYLHKFKEDAEHKREYLLCWDCDFDVMNGKDWDEDAYDISIEREEEEYEYDPINNPPPRWMQ